MEKVCRECGNEFDTIEFVRKHIRKHKISYQEYVLKWYYGGVIPLCHCGCNQTVNWNVAKADYASVLVGHSSLGKRKTEEQKKKIGEKNSLHMKKFMEENPEVALVRAQQMLAGRTPESERARIQATRSAYENMTTDELQKFSDRARILWEDGILAEAHVRATETFKERFAAGEYDFIERNKKISVSISEQYVRGGFQWSKGEYTSYKVNKTFYYRSSWEKRYMELLDTDESVGEWDYEFTFIPYQLDGIEKNYVPDFYVKLIDDTEKLVEIKPQNLKSTEMNKAKKIAAIKFCKERNWIYEEVSFENEE